MGRGEGVKWGSEGWGGWVEVGWSPRQEVVGNGLQLTHSMLLLPPSFPPGNALVYECVKAAAAIHPSPVLIAGAMESVSRFLASRCVAWLGLSSILPATSLRLLCAFPPTCLLLLLLPFTLSCCPPRPHRENNLRYAGIDALTRLVHIDPKHAQVSSWGVRLGWGPECWLGQGEQAAS